MNNSSSGGGAAICQTNSNNDSNNNNINKLPHLLSTYFMEDTVLSILFIFFPFYLCSNPMRLVLSWSSFYRWRRLFKKLSNLSEVIPYRWDFNPGSLLFIVILYQMIAQQELLWWTLLMYMCVYVNVHTI